MICYVPPLFRPPSEAESLIIQVSLGCSHNRCLFCDMYKEKPYALRPIEEVLKEMEGVSPGGEGVFRLFLADGDALGVGTDHLERILRFARGFFLGSGGSAPMQIPRIYYRKAPENCGGSVRRGFPSFIWGLRAGPTPSCGG